MNGMYVCMPVWLFVGVCVQVCTRVWKPESDVILFPPLHFIYQVIVPVA